jgi:3-methyladenine DNA glycosylase AlkD
MEPVDVETVVARLRELAEPSTLAGLPRYAIPTARALGVPMAAMRRLARSIGRDHLLARRLWDTAIYEARTVAALIADPARLTPEEMDGWCADFDSWAICDTVCFHLYDRSPHAIGRVEAWAAAEPEFVRRAAFALGAALALHDRVPDDGSFIRLLQLIERAADDDRNFVKKGVSWALVATGARNAALHGAALATAARLAVRESKAARWIARDATRKLSSPSTLRRLARREPPLDTPTP